MGKEPGLRQPDHASWTAPEPMLAPPEVTWEAARDLERIAGFRSSWERLRRLEPQRLASLRHDTVVQSTGASVRIEGTEVSDLEVERILGGLHLGSLRAREESEVRGCAELLNLFLSQPDSLPVDENHIKQYHAVLLGHSERDRGHRGEYKTVPVNITGLTPDGSEHILLATATPFDTRRLMPRLVDELHRGLEDPSWHRLALIADFILWFLIIHPFQDGNGRLARALHTLLLLQSGYEHVAYSSIERVIEERRTEYYHALRESQLAVRASAPEYQPWFQYTLRLMVAQQDRVQARLDSQRQEMRLSEVQRSILALFDGSEPLTAQQLSRALTVPDRTLRYNLAALVRRGLLRRDGSRRGASYRLPSGDLPPTLRSGAWLRSADEDGSQPGAPLEVKDESQGRGQPGTSPGGVVTHRQPAPLDLEVPAREVEYASPAAPGERSSPPGPVVEYHAARQLLAGDDTVAADQRRRELFRQLLGATRGWIGANAASTGIPHTITDHHLLESWQPVVEPLLDSVSPHLERYSAHATAMVEHESELLDSVAEDLLRLFEEPASPGLTWVARAPALVARIGCDTLLARAVWLRRWHSVGLLLRRRIPLAGSRIPWPGHPDYQHPEAVGRLPDVAAGVVLQAMVGDQLTHELGIEDELGMAAADANWLTGVVTITLLGSVEPPATYWGFRSGPSRTLLRTLADHPSAVEALCSAAGVSSSSFREGFARTVHLLAENAPVTNRQPRKPDDEQPALLAAIMDPGWVRRGDILPSAGSRTLRRDQPRGRSRAQSYSGGRGTRIETYANHHGRGSLADASDARPRRERGVCVPRTDRELGPQ